MHPSNSKLAAAGAIVAVLTAGCAGSAASPAQPAAMPAVCTRSGPVVFAVSGREDSPAPAFTGLMEKAAETATLEGSAIGLVDLDGDPQLTRAKAFSDPHVNAAALQHAQMQYLNEIGTAVLHTRATSPHADVLDTLDVAGRAIRSACGRRGTIYLEDSGLQETGPVNFRQPGMLGAAPADIVAFLRREGELPNLKGIAVVLAGIGDTAPPQKPLTISQRDNLVAIWAAITKAAGATSVQDDQSPRAGRAPARVPKVDQVPVPALAPWKQEDPSYTFPDSGPVGFEPNTAVFRDQSAAENALKEIAQYLSASPSARIELTGTTARWGGQSWDIALSQWRAGAVKKVLVALGANPRQIATRGVGSYFPGYQDDQGPNGTLLPGPAEANRSVIVTQG